MATRIFLKNNYISVDIPGDDDNLNDHKSRVFINPIDVVTGKYLIESEKIGRREVLLSELTNEAGTPYDLTSWTEFYTSSTGFNQGGGSPSGSTSADAWVYKHLDYTPTSRLTLSSTSFSETVISDNLELKMKTAVSNAHDGNDFKMLANDVIQVRVNMKIDGSVNNNLIRVKLRSLDGVYPMRQSHQDTNVQQFGQDLSFDFAALNITTGTATSGFDITISDFNSSADAFIYSIFITIQKVGTKK